MIARAVIERWSLVGDLTPLGEVCVTVVAHDPRMPWAPIPCMFYFNPHRLAGERAPELRTACTRAFSYDGRDWGPVRLEDFPFNVSDLALSVAIEHTPPLKLAPSRR